MLPRDAPTAWSREFLHPFPWHPFQAVEKVVFSGLVKNAQMPGSRNPPEVRRTSGYAATTKEEGNAADVRFSTAC